MKKYISWNGFYRFNNRLEFSWNFKDWALPCSIDFRSKYFIYTRILFLGIFIPKK